MCGVFIALFIFLAVVYIEYGCWLVLIGCVVRNWLRGELVVHLQHGVHYVIPYCLCRGHKKITRDLSSSTALRLIVIYESRDWEHLQTFAQPHTSRYNGTPIEEPP